MFAHKSLAQRIERLTIGGPAAAAAANNGTAVVFPVAHSLDGNIVGFGGACSGAFLMSCSSQSDFVLWSPDGEQLERVDTCLGNNYAAKVSLCGRFVAVCGEYGDLGELSLWRKIGT